jgi:hypothetical protein
MPPHRPTNHRSLMLALAAALLASLPSAGAEIAAPDALAAAPAYDFLGGCTSANVHQDDLTGMSWIGTVSVAVAATINGVPFLQAPVTDVSCELLINEVSQGTVLTAPNGTFATANAGRFQYDATPTDNVVLCTYARIAGTLVSRCSVQPVVPL